MQSEAVRERRFKVMLIEEQDILTFMRGCLNDWPQMVSLRRFDEVPADAQLIRVGYLLEQGAFAFLLAHASFSPVPLGVLPPFLVGDSTPVTVAIKHKLAGPELEVG